MEFDLKDEQVVKERRELHPFSFLPPSSIISTSCVEEGGRNKERKQETDEEKKRRKDGVKVGEKERRGG